MRSRNGIGVMLVMASVVMVSAAGGAPSVTKLPRLQQLWSLEGLGRFDGSASGHVYYTVANDGKSVQAIDVTKGRPLWRTPLPEPVAEFVRVRIHNEAVVLAYARAKSTDAVIAAVSSKDGKLVWSRSVRCENPDVQGAESRLLLICRRGPLHPPFEIQELEPATGRSLATAIVDQDAHIAPNGNVCGTSAKAIWCGRVVRDRVDVIWTQPGSWANPTLTTDHVIQATGDQLTVYRARDGQIVWKKQGRFRVAAVQQRTGRLFLVAADGIEIVQLGDGRTLGRVPGTGKSGANVLAEGDLVVVDSWAPGNGSMSIIDQQSNARAIAKNVPFLSLVVGDVLLSQNVGMSGFNRARAPLEAYSLSRFAPAEDQLDAHHKVIAILERHPFAYEASDALTALRRMPDAMVSVEKVIANGPSAIRSSAIAVAGLTGDPRFVGALRARLEAITTPPGSVEEWSPIVDAGAALADIRSPDAAVALLAFWNRIGVKIALPWQRTVLKDFVASAVWKFGARKEFVRCDDTAFPVERTDADKASLGTAAPGVAYFVDGGRRWAAICEARQDDNGDGKLQVVVMHHGDTAGDQLRPYLVLGSGKGTEIDDVVASDRDGRWVVTTKDMCVHLVDTETGKAKVLRGADGRPGDAVGGNHRAAAFSPDGKQVLYVRSDGVRSTVIQRDLQTGTERALDPGPGELSRTFFDRSGRSVVMEVLARDTDQDGLLTPPRLATTLMGRRCRGPVMSASFFGQVGDKPLQRVVSVDGGPVRAAPAGPPLEPYERPRSRYELARPGPDAMGRGDALPLGPFRWKVAENPTRR